MKHSATSELNRTYSSIGHISAFKPLKREKAEVGKNPITVPANSLKLVGNNKPRETSTSGGENEFINQKVIWSSSNAVSNPNIYYKPRRRPSEEFAKMDSIPEDEKNI